MQQFPFQKVYDYFAQPLVLAGPVPENMAPSLSIVRMKGDEIGSITQLPYDQVNLFFRNSSGKAALGDFIRMTMALAAKWAEPVCLVLMAEAYVKNEALGKRTKEEVMKEHRGKSLEDDPDATECIMISVYRPEKMCMGALHLNADRTLSYSPLMPHDGELTGTLTNHPDQEDLPEGVTTH